jgi:branched-chain amino acid transport system substrate-binding protein
MPTSAQASIYSSVLTYLKAVKAAHTTDSAAVMGEMKKTRIDEVFVKDGNIREGRRDDPRHVLFEVKKPSESKGRWDNYRLLATIPG